MKKLKLFFACLLMAVLSIGQVWADPAAVGTTLFSEDFSGYAKDAVPSGSVTTATGRVVYGNANVSYECTNGNGTKPGTTKIYTEALATGTSPEILIGKYGTSGTTGGTFSITGIPSGGAQEITVSYKQNKQKLKVAVSGSGYTSDGIDAKPDDAGTVTFDITVADGAAATFNLTFSVYSSNVRVDDILVTVKTAGEGGSSTPTCATPSFSPAAGAVASGTQVTISCSTDGATIHYTTDGTEPTTGSATYSDAITVSSAMTIKAIAVKDGYDNSSVASAAYTVLTPLTTMDEIFAAATSAGTTATTTAITFNNWVVTGVKNSNAYVTDGTKGFIVYTSSHGFQVGDILSGTAVCKVQLYNGSAELTELTASKVTVNTGGSVSPVVLDAEGIEALTGAHTGSVIKISGECTYESSKYYIAGVQLYNQLYSFSVSAGTNYECTGVYVQYNTTKEIFPRSAADIVAQTSVANPTFSPVAGEYTEVQNVTLSCATDGATVYYTTDGTNPTNESTVYSSAIEVGASMTIKAIAYKGEDHSEVVSAAYTINLPEDENVQRTWDLSIDETATASEDALTWTATYVDMSFAKGTSTTNANNYYPGTSGQSYTSTRTYKNSVITITPASSKQITTVVFTATTSGYATTLKNASWTNATAVASDVTVTVTASGSGAISAVLGGTTGFTSVTVHYEPYVAPTTYAVSFAAPEHGSLAIANGEDPISSGDEFVAGTELTVTAEPASGYLLDAIKVIETGSDPENDVTSTVLAGATLTVPAYAITVSATFVENVAPVATLTLSENGVEAPFAGEHHQGDVVNLPLTSSADCVKDFVGWSANSSCAVAPEYAPGAEYTLASTEQTLYAVYATASGSSYVKTALASIASGSEVVVTEAKTVEEVLTTWALTYNTTSKKTIASVVTESENVLDVAGLTNGFWILTKDGDNFSLTAKGTTDKLYCTNTNDGVRVGEGEANTFSINNEYLYTSATSDARYLGVYNATEFRCYTSINSNIKDQTLAFYKKTASYSDYATTCVAALADPVFTPAAGVYTEAKNVVITAEEGTIYYTTDGTDPTSSSTEYTAPIVLDKNGTTTIKAIAISATSQSAIVTAAYTINMPLSTMDQIFAAATAAGSTATDANIAFGNWVVSGVSTNGKNVYVTDGTKGFIIFDNGGEMGFAVGDVLSGTVACKVQLYKGAAELTTLSSTTEGLNIAKEGVITPAVKAINALSGINTGAAVTINSVQFDGTNLSDGANEIKPYNSLFAYDALESGKYYNVTGIYLQFDATKEILPRSAADIEELTLDDPELSYDPASVSLEVGQALSAPTFNNPHELTISYSTSNEAVATVSDAGVIALAGGIGTAVITASFAGNAQYAAGNATFTITVSEHVDAENVVIIAEYDSKFYALTNSISNKTAAAVEIEKDGSNIVVTSAEAKAAIQWKKITDGENTTFQDADDKYLRGTSGGGDLTIADAACNWSWDGTNNCYAIGTRSFIYRESANGFKNYSIGNAGGSDYSALAEVIEIDPENIIVVVPTTHTLSYNSNGGTVIEGEDPIADAQVAEGATVTVAANVYEKEGYAFAGWLYSETVYNAGQTFPMPTTDVELVAQWTEQVVSDYVLVTDVAQLLAGDKVIIVAADYNKAAGSAAATYRNVVDIEKTSDKSHLIFGASMPTEFTLGIPAAGEYTFNDGNGFMYESAAKSVKVQAESFSWSISIDAEAIATISATNELRYNHTSPRFTTYASGQDNLQLYRKPGAAPEPQYTDIRTGLTAGNYFTVCWPKKMTAIKGATLWSFAGKDDDMAYLIQEEAPFEAGKPFIAYATSEKLEAVVEGDDADAGSNNGLYGTLDYMDAAALSTAGATYMLKNNALRPIGTNNHLDANRAYVILSDITGGKPANVPAHKVRSMPMQKDAAQGFENIESGDAPVKVMIEGTLYILRGEKVYDATGRLVK